MITSNSRVVPNEEEVAAEHLDGEAIIINLANGSYYSTAGVGGVIWGDLAKGWSLAATCRHVADLYDVDPRQAERDVVEFVTELLNENLVTYQGETTDQQCAPAPAEAGFPPRDREPYAAPVLEAYRDMADMLALDPPMPGLKGLDWKPGTPDNSRDG